ncbi:MAG: glycosyltransferase family 39 protein [Mycobacteriales bacterium]
MSHDDDRPKVGISRWRPAGTVATIDSAPADEHRSDRRGADGPAPADESAGRPVARRWTASDAQPSGGAHDEAADPDSTRNWTPNFDNSGPLEMIDAPPAPHGRASAVGAPAQKAPPTLHRPVFDDADGFATSYVDITDPTAAGPAYAAGAGPRPGTGRPPLVVWLLTGAFAALMMMCTFLYPALGNPGEAQHADLIYSFANGNQFFDPGSRTVSQGVQSAQETAYPPTRPLADQQPTLRGQRQSLNALGGDRAGTQHVINTATQHPPLYYLIGAGVLRITPDWWPADRQIAILRYLSLLFLLPLPLLAWAAVRSLVGNTSAASLAAALPLAIPGLVRVGASVTNESLLILLGSVLAFLLARVVAGHLGLGTGLAVGVVTGLACLTQAVGLVFPAAVLVAYGVAWARRRRLAWMPLVAAGALTAALSAWWWIRNLALFHTLLPKGLGSQYYAVRGVATGHYSVGDYTHDLFTVTGWRVLGGLGMMESPRFSLVFSWIWLGALAVGVLLALGYGTGTRLGRGSIAVFLAAPVLTLLAMWLAGRSDFLFNGYLPLAQGRFLYPMLIGIFAIAAIGFARCVGERVGRWLPLAAIVAALATQAWAWRQLLHAWWTPHVGSTKNEIRETVRGILRFSPWAHPVTAAAFIAVAALGTLSVLAAIGYGAHRGYDEDYPLPR